MFPREDASAARECRRMYEERRYDECLRSLSNLQRSYPTDPRVHLNGAIVSVYHKGFKGHSLENLETEMNMCLEKVRVCSREKKSQKVRCTKMLFGVFLAWNRSGAARSGRRHWQRCALLQLCAAALHEARFHSSQEYFVACCRFSHRTRSVDLIRIRKIDIYTLSFSPADPVLSRQMALLLIETHLKLAEVYENKLVFDKRKRK